MLPRSSAETFGGEPCDDVEEPGGAAEEYPSPPERIPEWASVESREWRRLDEFDILAKAEALTGLTLEIKNALLPSGVWGIHLVRGERGRIIVNAALSPFWRRFAVFHELYHLLHNTKGARFWQSTFFSMESFENRADAFAWAAVWPEWEENQYCDWN
ncbi:ImmA/IrrE family metallo-endopeptidase [Synergistes jonesii]|uniref:ImmA/IrrE family metallo-endopeptidase n=1 Tax=Synergistes jonesii TaxID=2754 RepID=UPI00248E8E58|nr:ImmA/IrrE family metallo-endopeptidase [Synergistes jonesii]